MGTIKHTIPNFGDGDEYTKIPKNTTVSDAPVVPERSDKVSTQPIEASVSKSDNSKPLTTPNTHKERTVVPGVLSIEPVVQSNEAGLVDMYNAENPPGYLGDVNTPEVRKYVLYSNPSTGKYHIA